MKRDGASHRLRPPGERLVAERDVNIGRDVGLQRRLQHQLERVIDGVQDSLVRHRSQASAVAHSDGPPSGASSRVSTT